MVGQNILDRLPTKFLNQLKAEYGHLEKFEVIKAIVKAMYRDVLILKLHCSCYERSFVIERAIGWGSLKQG